MPKFRKKPVVIEAIQWDGINLQEVIQFSGSSIEYDINTARYDAGAGKPHVTIKIKTLEGEMLVSLNDYIIKGVKGEIYPCKPDIFNATYEEV